jgi:hypothetical protein
MKDYHRNLWIIRSSFVPQTKNEFRKLRSQAIPTGISSHLLAQLPLASMDEHPPFVPLSSISREV